MAEKKRSKVSKFNLRFEDAVARFARARPGELSDALTRDLVTRMKAAQERIEQARNEVEDGGRTRRGKERFRL